MTSSTTGGATTTYTYAGAAQNQVLSETTPGTDSYTYTYGGHGELLIQGTGGATYDVVNDANTGQALDLVNTSTHAGLYLYDGIGNPVGLLTDTGTKAFAVSFDPYGGQTVTAGGSSDWYGNSPYGFKSGTRTNGDALVKFGLRWYLPTTGTRTQRDTLDAPLDPTNANRYAYADDNPINNRDPNGRISFTNLVKLGTLLYDAKKAITTGSILSIAAGFAFEFACDSALDTLSSGTAAVPAANGCAVGVHSCKVLWRRSLKVNDLRRYSHE
ncbi:RHS repeat-associated core domain-containing protein [Curtobacterium sp. RRHDQ10]|uniref:RHS repeat-associated core domain-containing protein n=1 Tax=Curtobacterium phyllosphaerae TaxID=3413379 RepID=UPI003BF06580